MLHKVQNALERWARVRVFSTEIVDEVIWVESLERALSNEAGEESSRAKGHKDGIIVIDMSKQRSGKF